MTRMSHIILLFFFFNDTATTEIYTLSLHDALPISEGIGDLEFDFHGAALQQSPDQAIVFGSKECGGQRSEEHTSELQSLAYLVCRLLLEKKKVARDQIKSRNLHTKPRRKR